MPVPVDVNGQKTAKQSNREERLRANTKAGRGTSDNQQTASKHSNTLVASSIELRNFLSKRDFIRCEPDACALLDRT